MCDQGRTGHTTRPLDTPQFQKKQNIVMGDILKKNLQDCTVKKSKNKTLGCRAFKELIQHLVATIAWHSLLSELQLSHSYTQSLCWSNFFLSWNRVLHYLSRTWSLKQCLCFPSHQGSQMYGVRIHIWTDFCKFLTFIRISFLWLHYNGLDHIPEFKQDLYLDQRKIFLFWDFFNRVSSR